MFVRRLSVRSGNIEFSVLFHPFAEIEFQIPDCHFRQIDMEGIMLIDRGDVFIPVCDIDKTVSRNGFEDRSRFVSMQNNRSGKTGLDGNIFRFFRNIY